MRSPLGEFAARLVRNGEVQEFIRGLVREYHVPAGIILDATADSEADELSEAIERRRLETLYRGIA